MPEYEQNSLFDLSQVPVKERDLPRKYWYYVTDARNECMVCGLGPNGGPIWGEHDTRPDVGVIPHLFNTRGLAEGYKKKWASAGHVNKWLYSHK